MTWMDKLFACYSWYKSDSVYYVFLDSKASKRHLGICFDLLCDAGHRFFVQFPMESNSKIIVTLIVPL